MPNSPGDELRPDPLNPVDHPSDVPGDEKPSETNGKYVIWGEVSPIDKLYVVGTSMAIESARAWGQESNPAVGSHCLTGLFIDLCQEVAIELISYVRHEFL